MEFDVFPGFVFPADFAGPGEQSPLAHVGTPSFGNIQA